MIKSLYHMGKLVPSEDILTLSECLERRYEKTGNLDYHFLSIAYDVSNSSDNYLNMRVGCIIVKNGDIISSGYNDKGIHAEWIAIKKCMEKNISTRDTILYTNLQPCLTCAHLIIACKIIKVVYTLSYSEKFEDENGKLSFMNTDKLLRDGGVESLYICPTFGCIVRMENSQNWKDCTLEEFSKMCRDKGENTD